MGEVGVRSATFGAGAASELHRVDNIGGFKVVTLEKAYNGISSTFHLGNKGDFRSKFGTQQDPVSRFFSAIPLLQVPDVPSLSCTFVIQRVVSA
jgi:hypothetical protein